MELTVESLIGELGLSLVSGQEAAKTHVRWVHSTELEDPTPWLKGGEVLLTTGIQLTGAKLQRQFIERLVEHQIAGLGFGTGFAHKRLPAALVTAARKRGFLSGELYRRGLICRTDDRGDPIVQLSPPLIAGAEQFEEIEAVLRPVLGAASERVEQWSSLSRV